MGTKEDLTKAGLTFKGRPQRAEVGVGGGSVSVRVEDSGGKTLLTATVPGVMRDGSDLSEAGLAAEGDTSFRLEGGAVIGTRTLVAPTPGSAYDAVFELAKATISLVAPGDRAEPSEQVLTQDAAATAAMPVTEAVQPQAEQVATPAVVQPVWSPTHAVPAGGMRAWAEPHPNAAIVATLDAGLDLEVAETRGDWARVVASNGWTGWVDNRRLGRRA